MSGNVKYLTPKKPIAEIIRERAEQAENQNIEIYQAIAGLYEELGAMAEANAALVARVAKLEGGQ